MRFATGGDSGAGLAWTLGAGLMLVLALSEFCVISEQPNAAITKGAATISRNVLFKRIRGS